MDQHLKRMLKLIEEDADSFSKKAELYFKKRPELISLVEEFYRMYRSLAERYDHVTGELRKNVPSKLQSQSSGISDVGSEPISTTSSPAKRPSRKSGPRAAGFDFFLGSGSYLNNKETESESESESDDSSINNYSEPKNNGDEERLQKKILELEVELREVKEKYESIKESSYENSEVAAKIEAYEEDLRVGKEKIQLSEEEITRLMIELQNYKSFEDSNDRVKELQESFRGSEAKVFNAAHKIQTLEEELRVTQGDLQKSEEEIARLKHELGSKRSSSIQNLQEQLKSAQDSEVAAKIEAYEEDLRVTKEKIQLSEEEITRLTIELHKYKSFEDSNNQVKELQESWSGSEAKVFDLAHKTRSLEEELRVTQGKLHKSDKEIARLKDEFRRKRSSSIQNLQAPLKSAENEVSLFVMVKREVSKLLKDRRARYKTNNSIRDQDIRGLKEILVF